MAAETHDLVTRKEVVEYFEFITAEVRRLQDDQQALFKMMQQVNAEEREHFLMFKSMFAEFTTGIEQILGQRREPEQPPSVN